MNQTKSKIMIILI